MSTTEKDNLMIQAQYKLLESGQVPTQSQQKGTRAMSLDSLEAVSWKCCQKGVLNNFAKFAENTCVGAYLK